MAQTAMIHSLVLTARKDKENFVSFAQYHVLSILFSSLFRLKDEKSKLFLVFFVILEKRGNKNQHVNKILTVITALFKENFRYKAI